MLLESLKDKTIHDFLDPKDHPFLYLINIKVNNKNENKIQMYSGYAFSIKLEQEDSCYYPYKRYSISIYKNPIEFNLEKSTLTVNFYERIFINGMIKSDKIQPLDHQIKILNKINLKNVKIIKRILSY